MSQVKLELQENAGRQPARDADAGANLWPQLTAFTVASHAPNVSPVRVLTEADAVALWLARWLRVPRKTIRARYACDPRRIYEVWEGTRFPASRAKALEHLRALHPHLVERVDLSCHRRIERGQHPAQLSLFPER